MHLRRLAVDLARDGIDAARSEFIAKVHDYGGTGISNGSWNSGASVNGTSTHSLRRSGRRNLLSDLGG